MNLDGAQWRRSLLTRVDKVQVPPRSKGPPNATCKKLSRHYHRHATDIRHTDNKWGMLWHYQFQRSTQVQNLAGLINLSVRILCRPYILCKTNRPICLLAEERSFRREFRSSRRNWDIKNCLGFTETHYQFQNHVISPVTDYWLCILCYNLCHSGQCRAFLL